MVNVLHSCNSLDKTSFRKRLSQAFIHKFIITCGFTFLELMLDGREC